MKWIGLTGNIGAGKSTVSKILKEEGYSVVDADTIAHQCLDKSTNTFDQIVNKFGSKILNHNGEIDRKELGKIIFSDSSMREWLEKIIHPFVQSEVLKLKDQFNKDGHEMAFYEVPLLFEKNLENQFDSVLVVWVSDLIQKQRLLSRNNWSPSEINIRNESQWPIQKKIERANFSINNDGSIEQLRSKIKEVINQLKITNS